MLETRIVPDFITIDGAEGGTGAAPLEFIDHVGMPLQESLLMVHNTLVGIGCASMSRSAPAAKSLLPSYRPHTGHWRRLVQFRARLHVRAGLYPVAKLSHRPLSEMLQYLEPGDLINGNYRYQVYRKYWPIARAASFHPDPDNHPHQMTERKYA